MKIIHLPRYHVGRQWSPTEILAIEETKLNERILRSRERSKIACAESVGEKGGGRTKKRKAIAKPTKQKGGERARKREERREKIVSLLSQPRTVTDLMDLIGDLIARATVNDYLRELEAEGRVCRIQVDYHIIFWKKNELPDVTGH